ncbi:UDP-N-acetylmuramoyl-L-alanyl-D-glutamate--2,6-diaminopimelate ligase [Actinopolymorpha pittospori]|uniref:UDP-N-acetylmuramoyl-L-alanyl-D-glutamate--2,6-diaminopimelate ligase n=1 Tax=Actinopolymorpha pittospori TaxID=648752 RepID=A0A927RN67_9ACTN|nr:UDP-N-acetylmuramoyl-L-alanyl-D-glutamate--2,6-diaminopimelate ligase [Actinopolymorpha pittospori]
MAVPATGSTTPRPTHPLRRSLSEVASLLAVGTSVDRPDIAVTGVSQDSRAVVRGDLYVARPGGSSHGAAYAQTAARSGAVAALTDPAGRAPCEAAGLPTLVVPDPHAVLGGLSAWIYGYPARDLLMLGITGTNGKTTTAHLLDAALRHAGRHTGLLGTVGTRIGDERLASVRTTPEAPDLQALLAVMRERGVDAVSMEVSSHALAYGRVDGIGYDVAGFTNLTQDHLELHGDLESYFAAKASLFTPERARVGVVNLDDPYGVRLAEHAPIEVSTFSAAGAAQADWRAVGVEPTSEGGSRFRVLGPGGVDAEVTVGLPGDFNVANALLATAVLATAGVPLDEFLPAFASASLPGRMERVPGGQDFVVIVDYAHTPDAIAGVLDASRPATRGRLIAVIGCGGQRDTGKRPLMGAAAARHADVVVITDDNPRSEDPGAIRAAALAGAHTVPAAERGEIAEIGDRREAIRHAVRSARPGDTVLVLGKGHEQGQEIAGVVHPFDDRIVVQEVLAEMSDTMAAAERKGADC